VHSETRWEIGFSASEIVSTAFSNPNIFRSPRSGLWPSVRAARSMDQPKADLPRVTFTTFSPTGEGRLFEHCQ
jgi:hypothetical protein